MTRLFSVSCIKRGVELRTGQAVKELQAAGIKKQGLGPGRISGPKKAVRGVKQAQKLALFRVILWTLASCPGRVNSIGPAFWTLTSCPLRSMTLFGLKGVAAYTGHARDLGQTDDAIYSFFHEMLASMTRKDLSLYAWVGLALKCGEIDAPWSCSTRATLAPTVTPSLPRAPLGHKKGRLFSFPDMTSRNLKRYSSRARQRYICSHAWRDAPHPRLWLLQEIRSLLRPLRGCPEQGV